MKKFSFWLSNHKWVLEEIVYIIFILSGLSFFVFSVHLLNDLHLLVDKFAALGVYFPK